ncbi:MAG: Holliday junction resolvase RuvX [Gammaproteobacteria bacterium]|nr:Holliday junction resolvase RuvX [Gammaproteobacteria bacterium]
MPNKTINVVLGFDFGMSYIGVAVGQTISQTARALTTIKAQDGIPNWEAIADLINVWRADALIVGIPYNVDGTKQTITFATEKFARRLQHRFNLPVYYVDERYSTKEALSQTKNKTQRADMIAAKIIVESWLQEGAQP